MSKTLSYAGKNLAEFSMFFDSSKIYKKPSKQFSGYDIPGRNGRLYRSNNKFSNVIIEYQCYFRENFGENFTALINYLNSFDTYQRLEDTTDPSVYRMALFHAEVAPQTGAFLENGKFTLSFDCKPQEYYADGAEFERIVSHYDTYTGNPVVLENEGESTVTNLKVALNPMQDLNGYDNPWVGGAGKNKLSLIRSAGDTETKADVVYTVNADGSIDAVGTSTASNSYWSIGTVSLKAGNYILNGCPSGGSSNSYFIAIRKGAYNGTLIGRDTGSGFEFELAEETQVYVTLYCQNGTVADFTFYPMIRLASVTDATYEPYENICPITGHTEVDVVRTGHNQYDEEWELGSIASATGQNTSSTTIIRAKNYIPVYPNTQYYLSNTYGSNIYWFFYDANKTYLHSYGNGNGITVTAPANAHYMRIRWASGYGTTYRNDTVVNYPSSVTTYEPYAGHTYTTDLQTTVYGGTVDLATGVLTVDRASVNGGSLTWTQHVQSGVTMYYADIADGKPNNTAGSEAYIIASSAYTRMRDTVVTATTFASADDASFAQNKNASCRILVRDSRFSTALSLTNWMADNNVQFLYKLATPTTINLTPQQIELLTGMNYISSSGEVTVITLTPLILKNPSPMTSKPTFKFTNITAPFTVSANGETIISFQNAIRLIKHAVANNMTFDANGTTLTVTKTGTPAYTETSILINSGYLPAGRYSFSSATLGTLAVKSADGTETYSSGGTFTLTEITQVKVWYTITPSASTPQTINMPIFLRPLGDLYVNSELMDCYMLDGDTAYSFNECVELPQDFLELDDRTVMTMTSGAVGFIAPNWWRL